MKLFNNIAVVGLGLIGGSLAWAAKKKKLASRVIGVSRKSETIRFAIKNKMIDEGSCGFDIVKKADLVIIATPVGSILDSADKLSNTVKPGCIVIDVGSTKSQIAAKMDLKFKNYLGCHPMAGSEKRGIYSCDEFLFNNSRCILTPSRKTRKKTLAAVSKFWTSIGCKVSRMSPDEHDRIISAVSHLPHAAAFSLINTVPAKYLRFAASSLRDTTRIAGSDSGLWNDIFLSNKENLLNDLAAYEKELGRLRKAVRENDRQALINILNNAMRKRKVLNDINDNRD